jgi:hypothetical protein
MGPKGKAPSSKVTAGDVGCYNKGRHNEGTGQQEQRWFLRTKKKIGGKNGKKATSFSPNYVGPPEDRLVKGFHGVWDSEEGARGGVGDFVAYLNGALEVRAPKPRAAKSTATPCKQEMHTPEGPSLDIVLKRKRKAPGSPPRAPPGHCAPTRQLHKNYFSCPIQPYINIYMSVVLGSGTWENPGRRKPGGIKPCGCGRCALYGGSRRTLAGGSGRNQRALPYRTIY